MNKKIYIGITALAVTAMLSACSGSVQGMQNNILNNAGASGLSQQTKESQTDVQGTYAGYLVYGDHLNSTDEQKFVFPSFAEFQKKYLESWKNKLAADVKFLENRYVLTGYDAEHDWSKDFDVYMRYYALDDELLPVMYVTTLHCVVDDEMKVYVTGEESTEGGKVATAQQGNALGIISMIYDRSKFIPQQQDNQSLPEYLAENTKIAELEDPVSALERVAHVSGGKVTETIPVADNQKMCLVYTFADGSHLNYDMYKIGKYWFVNGITQDKYADNYRKTAQYIQSATAQRLRSVTKTLGTCGTDDKYFELSDNFLLLGEDKDKDAAMYGLFGEDAMVLRVGDNVYPIFKHWSDRAFAFAAADYDNDGVSEYAYSTCEGSGTGVYYDRLHVLEINDNKLVINNMQNLNEQLERITYRYDEAAKAVYWIIDGREVGGAQDISDILTRNKELKNIEFQSIQYIDERDGRWYLEIHPGFICDTNVSSDFDGDSKITAEIIYLPNGTFTLGDIVI